MAGRRRRAPTAPRIDGGAQVFAFAGYVRTFEESPPDVAQVVVEYRDAAGQVLERFDSGEISSVGAWQRLEDVRPAPVGTRWLRVRLLATRFTGIDNDAYFDALSLRSLRTATLDGRRRRGLRGRQRHPATRRSR